MGLGERSNQDRPDLRDYHVLMGSGPFDVPALQTRNDARSLARLPRGRLGDSLLAHVHVKEFSRLRLEAGGTTELDIGIRRWRM